MDCLQVVSLFMFFHYSDADVDWCSSKLDCNLGGKKFKNTVCEYKPKTSTSACENIHDSNTPDKRKEILHAHNEYRNAFANGDKKWPKAANMRQMTWDDKLEEVALRWAVQCITGHDQCRSTPKFNQVGQNYAMVSDSRSSPESTVTSFNGWVSEIEQADPSLVNHFKGGLWGHFTQVVWAKTYKLGCAQVQFKERLYKTVLICNYGPGGNVETLQMYTKGDPCTECPKGTKCKPSSSYPHLCASPDDPVGPQPVSSGGRGQGGQNSVHPLQRIEATSFFLQTIASVLVRLFCKMST